MRRCIRKLEGLQNRRSKGSKEVNFFRPVKPTMTNGPLIGEFAVPNKIANIFKHRSGSPLFRSGGPLTGCSNMFCNDGKSLKNLHFATLPKWTNITVFENRPKSRIQHCERSEQRLHFGWTNVNEKCPKSSILTIF